MASQAPSLCLESAVETEKTGVETSHNGNEEICAVRLSSALPPVTGPDQNKQEEDMKPGE